eukprot:COSAG01_NODE_1476_length_10188_cov_16.029537_8_plen_169_part_00
MRRAPTPRAPRANDGASSSQSGRLESPKTGRALTSDKTFLDGATRVRDASPAVFLASAPPVPSWRGVARGGAGRAHPIIITVAVAVAVGQVQIQRYLQRSTMHEQEPNALNAVLVLACTPESFAEAPVPDPTSIGDRKRGLFVNGAAAHRELGDADGGALVPDEGDFG